MKAEILSLLRSSKEYLSGQDICSKFGVSRTAVWKVINQLKVEGYTIEAVPKKGYRLVETPDLMSRSELESRIRGTWLGKKIYYYEETGSTNTQIKRLAEEEAPHGTVVMADKQTAGKGRRGRGWESPGGKNIFFSILLRPAFAPEQASMLTLIMAMAVAEGVEHVCRVKAKIKWPNDIVVDGKKICGILTELTMETDYIQYVVIGTGVNVNQDDIPESIKDTATSLLLLSGKKTARAPLLSEILYIFEEKYERFCRTGNMEELLAEYNERLANIGREVKVLDPQGEYTGEALGINEKGELLVRSADGQLHTVYAGEVSVRGLLGYV